MLKKFNCIKLLLLIYTFPQAVFASQSIDFAWESILDKIVTSLTGPVAYSISVIAIFCCGMTIAFADLQGGSKRLLQAACGISIAFFATQIVTGFLGFTGAVIS